MKPRIWPSLIIILTGVWICSAREGTALSNAPSLPTEHSPQEWKEFSSPEGHFTILFPGKPREYVQPPGTKAGRLEKRLYALETALATYIVAYDDLAPFSADPATIKQMLDSGRDQAIASEKGKLLEEKNISLDGYPGREIVAKTPEGILKTRVYVVRQRLYQIILFTPISQVCSKESDQSDESAAHKFFDSFRLTIKPEEKRDEQPLVVAAHAGRISRADGKVWLQRHGDTDLRPLRIGEKLTTGDVVLTGEQGHAEWSLNPGSQLQLSARSQVRVYETGLDQMHFDIERGEVFAIVSSLKDGAALELDTPRALLNVVKPGQYRIRVAADETTEAAVGTGELRFTNSSGKTISVTKGKRVRIKAS